MDRVALAKQGDYRFGSVGLSVCLFVLSWLNRLTYKCNEEHYTQKSHCKSKAFVCVSVIRGQIP